MSARICRAALSLALLALATPSVAEPPPAPSGSAPQKQVDKGYAAEILVLHATNSDKGIDPRIGPMPELSKPPFSSYKSYELLEKARRPLAVGEPKTLELPNKRVLQTELLVKLPKGRVKIAASINKPGGKTFLPLLTSPISSTGFLVGATETSASTSSLVAPSWTSGSGWISLRGGGVAIPRPVRRAASRAVRAARMRRSG